MYDYSKLRGRIIEIYGSLGKFGEVLGKDGSYVSRILNEKARITQEIINTWSDKLLINPDEIGTYFFTHRVDRT